MKNKKKLGLIGAVALTLIGTIALVAFVRSAEDRALADQEVVDVVVLGQDVPEGTPVAELAPLVETKRVPVAARTAGAVASLEDVPGELVTSVRLLQGEQLTASRLVSGDEFEHSGSVEIPEGMMEVTISLGIPQTIGGTLRPGELVAVATTLEGETGVVLHKMLVTNVQGAPVARPAEDSSEDAAARPPAPSGSLLVTFAVDVDQLQRVIWAAENGSVWLAREPVEAPELTIAPQTREGIYG